jgi:LruC domain-containing protein
MNATTGFNTYTGGTYIVPDTTNMQITFTRGLTQAEFGTVPFNPFIISNKIRGREIHLPGYAPTQKIDSRYYRTGADNTIPAQNKYFKTTTNLPWAVAFTEQFAYPAENKVISTAYTKFVNWAQSGGTTNTNWYKDSVNMVQSKIYRR